MRQFLKKVTLLLLPFLVLGVLLPPSRIDKYLNHTNAARNYKEWNEIIESKINADLIIQGSSRARVHISPKALDSTFNLNSYNLGLDGYSFRMQYYRFLLYSRYNKKPKWIIQTADYTTLQRNVDLYEYEQFIPYLNNPIIKEAVRPYEGFSNLDFEIPFYKYSHNPFLYIKGIENLLGMKTPKSIKFKGFYAPKKNWDESYTNFKHAHPEGWTSEIDTVTLLLFDKFVKYCVANDIKLIFLNSPAYFEVNNTLINRKEIDSVYRYYSDKYNIPFLNYASDSICLDKANFYNSQHLNYYGVQKFNEKLVRDLKTLIK